MRKTLVACALAAQFIVMAAQADEASQQPEITAPLGNAISYQGKLDKNGVPVNGNCNFVFKLYQALSGGTQVGVTVTLSNQPATSGLFSVALDFGAGAFDGQARWLEIQVQGPGDAGFTTLAPRATINAAPYALHALSAPGSGSQWVSSGDHLTYSGGNVGVLSHGGPFPAGDGVFLEGDYGTHAHLWAYNYDTNTPNSLVLNLPGGNVGIGTITPTSKLEIAAQDGLKISGFQPFMTLKDTGAGDALNYVQNVSGDLALVPSGLGGNVGMWLKKDTGRVGVGTSAPDGKLQATSSSEAAIIGKHTGNWVGVYGESQTGTGVWGNALTSGVGVLGSHNPTGALGYLGHGNGWGVVGDNTVFNTRGILGTQTDGVVGIANSTLHIGGRFENSAVGGTALYANGVAKVKTLQILGGADLAERFESDADAEPGTVMAIDPSSPGRMRIADEPYSRRVAGVVSGAESLPAGVVLGLGDDEAGTVPIALTGRVWVKCDASENPIQPGDLLTTSKRAGHAMVATDSARAAGAVLGKAMTSLEAGTGMVLVLVSLQ